MINFKFLSITAIVITTLAGIAHWTATGLVPILDHQFVENGFTIVNELSIIYIIIPFFFVELIRYSFLRKINWSLIKDSIANVITLYSFYVIEIILGLLFMFKVYYGVYMHFSLPHLPLNWVTIIICILLADLAYYWDHRMMHRIGIGWVTHTVHHSSPYFNMSVAYRFGPLDALFPIIFSLPIVALGFDPLLVLASELFVQQFQAILHTEVIGKLPRPIEFIFNTPSHHRVHHGSNKQYWDKNYAGIFIIWDRMFGTFTAETEPVIYGIENPINSTNPIKVFFHGFSRFAEKMHKTSGFKNKLLLFIKSPSWEPNPVNR